MNQNDWSTQEEIARDGQQMRTSNTVATESTACETRVSMGPFGFGVGDVGTAVGGAAGAGSS